MVACLSVMQRMKAPSRLHLMIDRESCTTSCYPWIDIYLSNNWVMGKEIGWWSLRINPQRAEWARGMNNEGPKIRVRVKRGIE